LSLILQNVKKLGVFATILASILALIQIWNWLAPNPARLRVLVKQDEVQIPSAYREYLHSLDSSYQGRKPLIEIHDTTATALKNSSSLIYLREDLAAMRAFAESAPIIFRFGDPHVITVKIVNVGWKVANDVKVLFANEGFVEISKDGTAVNAAQNKGWIDLGALEPSSQFIVTMWTTGSREGVRVLSDGGAGNVRDWYVSRDENRWVIGFGPTGIMFFFFIALVVVVWLLGVVVNAIKSPAERPVEKQEETEAHPPNPRESRSS
jgi:hypothetical protein